MEVVKTWPSLDVALTLPGAPAWLDADGEGHFAQLGSGPGCSEAGAIAARSFHDANKMPGRDLRRPGNAHILRKGLLRPFSTSGRARGYGGWAAD
jgi:hypothetical protein